MPLWLREKGSKVPGEKGDFGGRIEGEVSAFDLMGDNEAVDVGQGGGGVEKAQLLLRLLLEQEEDLLGRQGEDGGLALIGENIGAEDPLSQDLERLLTDALPVGGQPLEQEAGQTAPPGIEHIPRLAEPLGVDGVVLQHGANGGKGGGHHHGVGGGEQQTHLVHHLVQLPGGQPKGELAQIHGDVLGDLRLPRLQDLGQLHRHLVPAVRRQDRGDGQQGGAGHPADHDVLADLHQIGEVGGDVEDVGMVPLLHLVQQVLHAHGLQDPGGGGLQVVQEHVAHRIPAVQLLPQGGHVQTQPAAQAGLQEEQRRAALAVRLRDRGGDGRRLRPAGSRAVSRWRNRRMAAAFWGRSPRLSHQTAKSVSRRSSSAVTRPRGRFRTVSSRAKAASGSTISGRR